MSTSLRRTGSPSMWIRGRDVRNISLWLDIPLWIILFLCVNSQNVLCINSVMPFIGDETIAVTQDQPGCYMDGIYHAFGDLWSPVFIPQGVMVCIKCECLPIEKKGIVQTKGEIVCRNIKDLCPEPDCDHPVLRPGKCCKTCKTKDDFESTFTFRPKGRLPNNIYSFDDAGAYQPQEFEALLVGRHVLSGHVRTKAVAMVHISTTKGRIQFAVRYSRLDRPKYLKLLDMHGNVLFEKPIQKGIKGDRKVCGSWQKVPAIYLSYFRQEKVYAVITTSKYPDGIVAGKIRSKQVKSTETFSGILNPSKADGNGGDVKMDFSPGMKLATYVISLEGLKKAWKKGDFHISIVKGSQVIHRARGAIVPTTGKLSGSWRIPKRRHRKQLARGRLRVKVTFSDGYSVTGTIQPRLICGVFQAVLSSGQTMDKKRTSAAGSAVIQIGENGRLDYSIRVSGLSHNLTIIRLEGPSSKYGRNSHVVGNLYKTAHGQEKLSYGWRNGTYRRLEAEDMVRLLNNQLYINIATTRHKISELRGRLVSLDYHENFDSKATPVSLVPVSKAARGGAAHAWLSLGVGCVLHFDASLVGAGRKSRPFGILLGSRKNRQRTTVLKQRVGKHGDLYFNYRHSQGEMVKIPDDLLLDLNRGDAYLQITAKKNGKAVYESDVTLPNTCWQYSNDMDMDNMREYAKDNQTGMISVDSRDDVRLCNFEGQLYEDGDTWLPDVNATCTTCSCVTGKILCQAVICPKLSCDAPIQRDGDCCPSCPHEIETETCQLGKDPRKYRVHSLWHPYLPMEGFTKCAICTCMPGSRVECEKLPCPVPNCPRTQWVPSDTDPCCYQCGPEVTTEAPYEEEFQKDINMNGACDFLGQIKSNGEKWHPDIKPFGYMKCFFCECQDGVVQCGRMECPDLLCAKKIKRPGACCQECDENHIGTPVLSVEILGPKNLDCRLGGKEYKNGKRWRPISSPVGNGECAVCQCVEGSINCRLRCPRVCKEDKSKDPCCVHCANRMNYKIKSEDPMMSSTDIEEKDTALQPTRNKQQRKTAREKQNSDPMIGNQKDLIALLT